MSKLRTQFGEYTILVSNAIESIALHKQEEFFNKLWIYPGTRADGGLLTPNTDTIYLGEDGDGQKTTPDALAPGDPPMRIELPQGEQKKISEVLIQGTAGDAVWYKFWPLVLLTALLAITGQAQERYALNPATTRTVCKTGGAQYQTITAAKNAAKSGDTVVVYPGTYREHKLGTPTKSVDYIFYGHSDVLYSNETAASDTTGIFDDRDGPITNHVWAPSSTFRVDGLTNKQALGTVVLTNPASDFSIKADKVLLSCYYAGAGANQAAVHIRNCTNAIIEVNEIYSPLKGTSLLVFEAEDPLDDVSQQENSIGVYWELGKTYLKVGSIHDTSGYGIWGNYPLAANSTDTNEIWITIDDLNSYCYFDGSGNAPNWKSWWDVKSMTGGATFYQTGRHYMRVEKCLGGIGLYADSGNVFSTNVALWFTCQKMSSGAGPATSFFTTTTNTLLYAQVDYYDSAGAFPLLAQGGGEVHIKGGYYRAAGTFFSAIQYTAGTSCRLQDMTIDTSALTGTPAQAYPVTVASPGLVLDKCVLVAPGTSKSVFASTAQTITAYNTKASVAKDANVTVNVDALTVDSNVK
jgi:hypothetical protein